MPQRSRSVVVNGSRTGQSAEVVVLCGSADPSGSVPQGCLGLLLTGEAAGQYLESALKLNMSFFGPTDTHTAFRYVDHHHAPLHTPGTERQEGFPEPIREMMSGLVSNEQGVVGS